MPAQKIRVIQSRGASSLKQTATMAMRARQISVVATVNTRISVLKKISVYLIFQTHVNHAIRRLMNRSRQDAQKQNRSVRKSLTMTIHVRIVKTARYVMMTTYAHLMMSAPGESVPAHHSPALTTTPAPLTRAIRRPGACSRMSRLGLPATTPTCVP